MKPGDYANGRTFLGWKVRWWTKHLATSGFYRTREEARATKPFWQFKQGHWKRRITRVYRKDSPMRAALREVVRSLSCFVPASDPALEEARKILEQR